MDDNRQAAIEHFQRIIDATDTDGRYNLGFIDGLEFCINHLSTMPSAQPEQKSGKWIYPSGIVGFGRCSECKALWDYSLITNRFFRHCPRCGAEMENCPFKDTEMEVEE